MLRHYLQPNPIPMKYRFVIPLLFLGLSLSTATAQEGPTKLEDQFTEVMESSNRYKNYKVIKVATMNNLQRAVLDTVSGLRQTIVQNQNTIQALEARIDSLELNTQKLTDDLALSRKKENGMEVFGMIIQKGLYQTILWSIIGFLIFLNLIVFFRFRKSNAVTKEAKEKLEETETEFETHRQRAFEREQQLRRKLQDEINKQKE